MEYLIFSQPLLFLALVWTYCRIWGFQPKQQ